MALSNSRHIISRHGLPHAVQPVLRAYVLGYASSTTPRLLTLLLTHLSRRRKNADENPHDEFCRSFMQIIKGGFHPKRFATFCAALVGSSILLQSRLSTILNFILNGTSQIIRKRLSIWLSSFIAGYYSLKLLQSKHGSSYIENVVVDTANGPQSRPIHFAGRTMDLTLFALTRALDVVIGEIWSQHKKNRSASSKHAMLDKLISKLTDPAIFATSSALIMWAWIYTPDRLPRSYNKWIKSAAAVDERLVTALRKLRYGEIKYGEPTSDKTDFLESMCKDYHLPLSYANPRLSIPFPCELVHMGTGKSCEYHALSRLFRSFMWAFSSYLPLNLILSLRKPSKSRSLHALISSLKSSAFLGSFIALYYYGICLARTRLGPHLIGSSATAAQKIDSGICIMSGCAMCGWSVMLENASRQKELGMFVAPRALATLLPRRYEMRYQWRENVAFAISVAVVFTCVREKPERVRGVFGRVLKSVLIS